ncbi:MAG: ABC transporter ATP-binding protein [Anaerolineales bacterium]|uniref:ABC transporter ATP-binding protein n=1 Tax=Candidatus Desulfolinea nitratireducens TaxID=2841698 RepID=A0A8J6TFF6_9CHLR|nr:ABC transporter ATP-binding protein [Candidatus Desulfolinea nitratireducens]
MIHIENLSKKFNDFLAVDNVTLDVKPGQILALLGQNGAGKTTTIRMLTGLLRPTQGRAEVAGYDVEKESTQVRASVGVLTEHHGLYLRMTAVEYLDFFGKVYRLSDDARMKRINHLLEYFGLVEASHRRIGEYSKGMKQKLALARSLIHEPPALLLDEPTSAMDPESARLVRDEIASLRSSQRAIVICTHNLAEAEALADQIAIIYRGRILIRGKLAELKERVLGPAEYEVSFSKKWDNKSLKPPAGVEIVARGSRSIRFRSEQPQKNNPLLLKILSMKEAPVLTLQEVPRSLEQVYLKTMSDAGGALLQ